MSWGVLEIRYKNFFVTATGQLLCGVGKFDLTELELLEDSPHLGNVIQRKNKLGLQSSQARRHGLEVSRREIVPIELQSEIRRVEVEKSLRPVKANEQLFVREILNLHPCKSHVRLFDDLRKAIWIQSGWLRNVTFIVQAADQSRIAVFQQIQVARCALDVGERFRIGRLEKLMPFPTHEHKAEIAEQFFVMLLAYPEEIHHLAVEIVQDLYLRRLFVEEDLCAARERLNVGCVFREDGDDLPRYRSFAADVGQRSDHVWM